ncbi:hypothetical protein D3C85_1844170 [compost metagenome]
MESFSIRTAAITVSLVQFLKMYDYANALKPVGTPLQYSDIITIRIKRVASQHFFFIAFFSVWLLFSRPNILAARLLFDNAPIQ